CIPDNLEIKLIISCRWPFIKSGIFNFFPKNATKSLFIYCNGEEYIENNLLNFDGTFNGFNELKELKIINCYSNKLSNGLFDGLPKLRSLSIIGSKSLKRIDEELFFRLTKLESLILVNNGLIEFPYEGICYLQKLQVLNLSQNLLNSLGILSDHPCQLINLIVLNIAQNNIQLIKQQNLRPFSALRQLNLFNNKLIEIELNSFQSIPLLQHLDLSFNKLIKLPNSLPEGLLHLDISFNKFKLLPEAIIELPGLVRLNLSGNSFKDEEINKIPLQSSGMEQLDISWNLIKYIPINLFSQSTDSLLTLKLAGNLIEKLYPGQMGNFSSLQELDLSSNKLFNISIKSFEGLNKLLILQLFNNSIQKIDDEAFQELGYSLTYLNISQNSLTELPVAIGRLSRVKKVDLSNNKISKVYKFVLNKMLHLTRIDLSHNLLKSIDNYVFVECEHLIELNLNSNNIQTINSNAFNKCPKLRKIDLSGNLLNNLGTALNNLNELKSLNLSENIFEELNWSTYPNNLIELFINNNKIKRIITIKSSEFNERKLKKLNLHSNRITYFTAELIPINLEELNLSENLLSYIDKNSTQGMSQLKMLDLSLNKLQIIPKELFEITVIVNSPFGQMLISENPLTCNCEMEWLLTARNREGNGGVKDINEVKCLLPLTGQIKYLKEIKFSDFLCPYNLICEPNCPCCQLSSCDCKSICPKACDCFRNLNFTKNIIKCNGKKNNELDLQELPMQSTNILLTNLNITILKKSEFFGMGKLEELHINSSNIQIIEPSAFNTINNLK
ncbi:TIR domain-containing protein, partial [Meloidogyne graminicola]